MCTDKWVPDPGASDPTMEGHYDHTDCGKCSCGSSSARHSRAIEKSTGMAYCTTCDEYIL